MKSDIRSDQLIVRFKYLHDSKFLRNQSKFNEEYAVRTNLNLFLIQRYAWYFWGEGSSFWKRIAIRLQPIGKLDFTVASRSFLPPFFFSMGKVVYGTTNNCQLLNNRERRYSIPAKGPLKANKRNMHAQVNRAYLKFFNQRKKIVSAPCYGEINNVLLTRSKKEHPKR